MPPLLNLYLKALPPLLGGLALTLQISLCALLIGLSLGIIVGVLNSKHIRHPLWGHFLDGYIALIRGTPVFVQVLVVYFGLPSLTGWDPSPVTAGTLTLGCNSLAYISEIIRGSINAIDSGQWEACQVLGYSRPQAISTIILPQALWNSGPALVNEMVSLVKESSILMMVGVAELTKVSKDLVAYELRPMEIYLLCALFYICLTATLQLSGRLIERSKPWES